MTKISKECGLPFMADMVRAVRADRKTQTRRICKLPHQNPLGQWEPTTFGGPNGGRTSKGETVPEHTAIWHTRTGDSIAAPYIVGDRLWVRENYRLDVGFNDLPPREVQDTASVWYEADVGLASLRGLAFQGKLRPGMFMCRWMSRILLEVVSVRVERLQDISDADALAEGVDRTNTSICGYAKARYRTLWEKINGAGSWDLNPWVWVVVFKRITP